MEPAPDSQCRVPNHRLNAAAGGWAEPGLCGSRELQLKLRAERRIPPLQAVGARHSPALAPCLLTPLSPDPEGNPTESSAGRKTAEEGWAWLLEKNKTNLTLP